MQMISKLKCSVQGHQGQPLNYVCISQQRQQNPLICYLCKLQQHEKHDSILLKIFISQLMSVDKSSYNLIPLCAQLDSKLQKISELLKKSLKHFNNSQLILRTFWQFKNYHISKTLQFDKIIQKIKDLLLIRNSSQLINKLNSFIKSYYFKYFSQIEQQQWKTVNINQHLIQNRIQQLDSTLQSLQKLSTSKKINDVNVLNLFHITQQQNAKIKVVFSQQLKAPPITILSVTHAKYQKAGTQRLTILEPCLSKTNSIKKWCVKIVKLVSWIGVGICHINQIKKANFNFNYTNTGHGSYLISSNGYSWSSYKKQFNSHFQPFTFTTDDIIHIQYDPKQHTVLFRKQSDPNKPTFKLEVQVNDDPIHPQLNMTGIGDEIQIINY